MRTPRWMALALVASPMLACSESNDPVATESDVDLVADVALIAAEAATADLEILSNLVGDGPAATPGAGDALGGGVTSERNRSITFLDESGAEMDGYDALLTASIIRTSNLTRSIEGARITATQESSRETTVSGLLGEETVRTFDGAGSESTSRAVVTGDDSTRTYAFDGAFRILSVVRAVDRAAQPWPLSGSIEREVTVTRTGTATGDGTRTHATVLTFDGTQFATLVVDGESFVVDLSQPRGSRDSTRRGTRGGR